ncbi:acyl-CoA thioesterase [Acinetobacter sp.]|uniref:acyl-CoA thioesterase n=1 Tax=Acinetobacter sp. TaxID=472 RepID=UPI00281B439A|nr:acyl-CoA thioesterase [Acinetobacter sp.]MDR0238012.1 acyl-CoA thioesterase [Acinetobacter sp.]
MVRKIEGKSVKINTNWSTDQDCYLIENSTQVMSVLLSNLPFSEDEIRQRKEVLGLVRRQKQMMKGR